MSITPPETYVYGTVTFRALTEVVDSPDLDRYPDVIPATGTIIFTPRVSYFKDTNLPATFMPTPITGTLDAAGYMIDGQGNQGVVLVDPNSPGISPSGWTYSVSMTINGRTFTPYDITIVGGTTVDLTTVMPASVSVGTVVITSEAARIAAEEAADTAVAAVDTLAVNVTKYGAVGDGVTDDYAAITAAIADAKVGSTLYFGRGTWGVAQSIRLKDGLIIDGLDQDSSTLKALPGFSGAAILLATSGDTVSNCVISNIGLDGNFAAGVNVNGISMTNAPAPRIHNVKIVNVAHSAILLQGISGGGCADAVVTNNVISGAGLINGTTGFGILIKDASHRALISENTITNVVGGMGIGLDNGAVECRILGNYVTMSESTTGFEAIGITASCIRTVICNNNIGFSWDNGISASAAYSVVNGNIVNGCRNHGIQLQGDYSLAVGNVVRNPGQQNDATYGGMNINAAGNCHVAFNQCYDDQTVHTMDYIVKVHTSGGNNVVAYNNGTGYTQPSPYGDNFVAEDKLLDVNTNTDGVTIGKTYINGSFVIDGTIGPPSGGSITFSGDQKWNGRMIVGVNASALGQFTSRPTLTTRSAVTIVPISASQTAPILDNKGFDGTTTKSGALAGGTMFSDDAAQGVVLKSADGHYWRLTVSNAGALVQTDLGTTRPTS